MGIRMGITKEVPNFNKYIDCSMAYDYNFISKLEFVMVECNKCEYKESMGINSCYGCYLGMDGYYILPRQRLLDNPSVTNYEAMLEIFEDNNIDEIYLILS